MNIDKPPVTTQFADTVIVINRPWIVWFNSIYNRLSQLFTISDELKLKVYRQGDEPAITANEAIAIWKNTSDSNRIYVVFRRGDSDQVKIELM